MAFGRVVINLYRTRFAGEQTLVEDLRELEAAPYGPDVIPAAEQCNTDPR